MSAVQAMRKRSPTRGRSGGPRPLLAALALVLAVGTLGYTVLLMAATRPARQPGVELGFDYSYRPADRTHLVTSVRTGSPAKRAGLLPGDRIVAINGQPHEDETYLSRAWMQHQPGDTIRLTIERPGNSSPLILTGVFSQRRQGGQQQMAERIRFFFPVPFVLVGLAALFLHLEDRNVWLLALLFASLGASAGTPKGFGNIAPALRPVGTAYQAVLISVVGPLLYFFFATFPARAPVDRRLPWLKWAAIAAGLSFGLSSLGGQGLRVPPPLSMLVSERVSLKIAFWFEFAFLTFGLLVLAQNFFRPPSLEARRKLRVIFWGTIVALTPALAILALQNATGFDTPDWLDAALKLCLFIFPLSFAYAVVKHRVLDIPVLLKRSARYLLVQRGFVVLVFLVGIDATWLLAEAFTRLAQPRLHSAVPVGLAVGVLFGSTLVSVGLWMHRRVSSRIDRAFFRAAYDARLILEDLAHKTRTATSRRQLAGLLRTQMHDALQPETLAVYLESADSRFEAESGQVPPDQPGMTSLPALEPLLSSTSNDAVFELLQSGRPWEVWSAGDAASPLLSALGTLKPECLVPMQDRNGRLVGLLVLGPRFSEEPYSREDLRLLASVASQAAIALENIRLAEDIAQRIEAERLVAKELEIAKEVQARLFPQNIPPLRTLEYAGRCIQAKGVGGDYYDFLDFGDGQVGLILADIVGKGIASSLLMANFQANLRGQAVAHGVLEALLESVNRLFYGSTLPHQFATVFFSCYDDTTRCLRYANCGHPPPFLVRAGGAVERLPGTATVLGLFEKWNCAVVEVLLAPGDLLVIYSDGLNEARGSRDEEFGEERLLAAIMADRHLPVPELMNRVIGTIQEFSAGRQDDDMTLLIARAR